MKNSSTETGLYIGLDVKSTSKIKQIKLKTNTTRENAIVFGQIGHGMSFNQQRIALASALKR